MSDKDTLGQDREALGIDGRPRRRGTRWLGALCGVALLGAVGYAYVKDEPDETPVVATQPTSIDEPAPEPTPEPTAEEIAEAKAEQRAEDMERAVQEQLCLDYGERYVAAKTGVQLMKAVQLSQAAGCDWKGMLHADAVTHDFVPEAVEAMRRLDASEVTTGGSSTEEDADRLDRLDRSISDLDSKVDQLRYRIR
jgi:hypothetical protein